MPKQTIISTPSIADINYLLFRWRGIPGNQFRPMVEFYTFLTENTPERTIFLNDYTIQSLDDVKGHIVVLKLMVI
jgi:hypothetical protein